jgi:hypothetical protein
MLNPRLIETATRWMNPVPIERGTNRNNARVNARLVLQRQDNGKPIINLNRLHDIAINTPTRTDALNLMRVFECGGWRFGTQGKATNADFLKNYTVNDESLYVGMMKTGFFRAETRDYFQEKGYTLITPLNFYSAAGIDSDILNEINLWFDQSP